MDPFEALGDHRLDAQQERPLGSPVAARSGAVLLAGYDNGREALRLVPHCHIVNRQDISPLGRPHGWPLMHGMRSQIQRISAFHPGHQPITNTDVGEGAAHHHLMIAAARAILIELGRRHTALEQIVAGRAVRLDGAGRRDVIGSHAIPQEHQHARAENIANGRWFRRQVGEEGWLMDIGAMSIVPGKQGAAGRHDRVPQLVAGEHVGILLPEQVRMQGSSNGRLDLLLVRPDVPQVDGPARFVHAEWITR